MCSLFTTGVYYVWAFQRRYIKNSNELLYFTELHMNWLIVYSFWSHFVSNSFYFLTPSCSSILQLYTDDVTFLKVPSTSLGHTSVYLFALFSCLFLLVFPEFYCFLFQGGNICRAAYRSLKQTFAYSCTFCAFNSSVFPCETAGSLPSLGRVPVSLRIQVYRWQDACLLRHRECGCLP